MLCRDKKPNNTDLFQVPFGPVLTWKEIINTNPNIINEMNGSSEENYLLFYYELNPVTLIYKPLDEDSENDLADIFGLDIYNISTGETESEEKLRKPLNDDTLIDDDERSNSLASFMGYKPSKLTKVEIKKLLDEGISIKDYYKLLNEDSISSTLSNLSFESVDDNGKRKNKGKTTNPNKLAKKERRKLLIDNRIL
jgi:hypothetical protein